jgi:hypothetical protein
MCGLEMTNMLKNGVKEMSNINFYNLVALVGLLHDIQ